MGKFDLSNSNSGWELSPASKGISGYDSLDVLWNVNPEMASVAYAHKDGLLNSEILPYLAHTRQMQSDEKIALAGYMVDVCAIDSGERVAHHGIDADERVSHHGIDAHLDETRIIEDTRLALTHAQEDGMTARTGIVWDAQQNIVEMQEGGLTERTKIEYGAAVDMMKLKCDADVRIMQEVQAGNIKITELECTSRYKEVTARMDALKFVEQVQGMVAMGKSRDELYAKIVEAEKEFAARTIEARMLLDREESANVVQITKMYIQTQLAMMHASVFYEVACIDAKVKMQKREYKTADKLGTSLIRALAKMPHDYLEISATLPSGNFNFKVNRGYNGNPPRGRGRR